MSCFRFGSVNATKTNFTLRWGQKQARKLPFEVIKKLETARTVTLTEEGVTKAEQLLGIENLYDESNMSYNHHLNQALKAHCLLHRDRDYVVSNGQVVIVDEFTGRLMFGRRYNDGLHQALEPRKG